MTGLRTPILVSVLAAICSIYTLADGGADFKSKCAACHGKTGAGDTTIGKYLRVRDLSSAEVQKQSDDELLHVIEKGKGKMPAYDGKMSKSEMGELVRHIRSLKK